MKKVFILTACIIFSILSSVSALADEEIRFTLSAEEPENNSAEVVLVCDRNPGISEGEFNILYNSSILSLSDYEFSMEGFSTEEFSDEGRMNVRFVKKDNALSSGGKLCSLIFNIKNSNERLAGVTIEFISLKDSDGNDLNRLVESCEISIPEGIVESLNSDSESYGKGTKNETDEESRNTDSSDAKDAISTSIEDKSNITETVLLIIGGIMIVAGASVLFFNVKSRSRKQR